MLQCLFVAILLSISIQQSYQDCTVLPEGIEDHELPNGCCDLVKWTETVIERKCKAHSDTVCRCNCIFHDANLINENGAINADNVKSLFEAELKLEPDYIPIAIKSFEMCYPLGLKEAKNRKYGECELAPALVLDCVIRNMFVNCLPNKWKTSAKCEAAKTFMAKCPMRHVP